jgi:hypothetical protein
MAIALVGSLGTVAQGTTSATPAYGQTPTAGNLLVCWVSSGSSTNPSNSDGTWSGVPVIGTGGRRQSIYYKIAAGGDAAPTITGGNALFAMLGEFSGVASTPLDQSTSTGATGTTSPQTATLSSADAHAGDLVLYSASTTNSTSQTEPAGPNVALNNGASSNETTNGGSSVTHYWFGWGVTTGNSAADSASLTFTTARISAVALTLASFSVAVAAPVPATPNVVMQAVNRALTY